ncbi:MAG: hypothetical protein JWR24_2124 [Actinoallomurus sp.]|nr:hypothetical protein [Actinoallomurus sp.]
MAELRAPTGLAHRLQAEAIAAGGQLAQHPLQRHGIQHIGGRERLIRRHRHLGAAIDGAALGRRTGTLRPPSTTDPALLPCRTAVRSGLCLPRGPQIAVTLSSSIAAITCMPAPTARASRPSRTLPAISAIATCTCSGIASPASAGSGAVAWVRRLLF